MKRIIPAILALALGVQFAGAEISVTIYNNDLGLVHETRELRFPVGEGEVKFTDVAAQIIPTSVHFSSSQADLLEQNYEYDLVDAQKLLERNVDRIVELFIEGEDLFRGVLLSAKGDLVIRTKDSSIRSFQRAKVIHINYPEPPENLVTRPTLVWKVQSKKGGKGKGEISYLTRGISWETEYVAVTDEDDKTLELSGWVNINNRSGATYKDANVKLIAGDVQTIQKRPGRRGRARDYALELSSLSAPPQFAEETLYEYHLYTLQRKSTINDQQIKQISLFEPAHVKKLEKEYIYNWNRWKNKVRVYLRFDNTKANGLEIPLPKGIVRFYKRSGDGELAFIGEDRIDHTPRREEIKVSTGNAFDVVGERKVIDKQRHETTVELKIRNRKDSTIKVTVQENIYGEWEIIEATDGWKKTDSRTIEWNITLKPDEEKVLQYRVSTKR